MAKEYSQHMHEHARSLQLTSVAEKTRIYQAKKKAQSRLQIYRSIFWLLGIALAAFLMYKLNKPKSIKNNGIVSRSN